ncbi:MAG: ABC transporter substrate-binding protein [Xanthobacteraceae bacterium]
MLIAQTKGLQFVGVAPGASSTGERGHDFSAIVAPGDSPIQNGKDLVGKTVAVNNLNNIGDTSVRAGVRAAGGDPKQVKFIEVPFPDMPAALAEHRIEAGWVVEPFLTIAVQRGAKVVDWNLVDVAPKMMIAVYFTSVKYANDNPDIVNRSRRRSPNRWLMRIPIPTKCARSFRPIPASRPKSPPRSRCRAGRPSSIASRPRRSPTTRWKTA